MMTRTERLLYSFGALGGNAVALSLDLWLLFFFLGDDDGDPPRRVPALLLGGVLVAVRLVEAFDDPYIGFLSDRSRSRWGRRIPFVAVAAPLTALTFVLVWIPPADGSSYTNAAFLFGILWLYYLANTFTTAPYEAMLPEIAQTRHERMSVATWQVGLGVAGAALALVLSGPLIDAAGFAQMAAVMAVVGLATRYLGLIGAWRHSVPREQKPAPPPEQVGLWTATRACLRNRAFLCFLPSFILYQLGVQLIIGVLPFLVTAILLRDDTGGMVAVLTAASILTLVVALPGVFAAVRLRGKRHVYALGMLAAAIYFPLMAGVGLMPGLPVVAQAVLYAVPLGLVIAPAQVLPPALLADICDYDQLRTGMRREGLFYSTAHTIEKTARALGPGILALLLVLGRTPDDPLGVRLVGPVAGVCVLAGYLVFRRYALPDEVNEASVGHLLEATSAPPRVAATP